MSVLARSNPVPRGPMLRATARLAVAVWAVLTSVAGHAIPIQDWCALQGGCFRTWEFESIDSGAYRQDGGNNVPSGNYIAGVAADQGASATLSIYRDFFAFRPTDVGYAANTRLIAQLQVRRPGLNDAIGLQGSERFHLFDPLDGLAAGARHAFIDGLLAGTGGVSAWQHLGGEAVWGASDFGSAVVANNDFMSLGIVNLDIDAIARIIEASVGADGDDRFVVGGSLEDYFFNPITGSDGLEHFLFSLTGRAICPTCGAKLVIAEIAHGRSFPVAEPSTLALAGLAFGALALGARRARRGALDGEGPSA